MTILDDILNKNKNKGVNSFLPVLENNLDEQAENFSIIADGTKNVTAQENIQAEQSSAQPEIKYPNKPQGLNDGEYEHLLKYYSPEAITKFSAPFDPSNGENVLQRYFESSMPKPYAPDEKKLRNRRTIAGIADGVSMLSQMFSAGQGAYMRERDDSALAKVADMDKVEANRYLQLSQRYNDGKFQARIKDYQQALNDYNNGRKSVQVVLATKQKMDQAQTQFEEKQRLAYDKLAQDQANKDADRKIKEVNQKSLDRHRKVMETQGWSRVADTKNRTSAYVKKMSSSGSGKNSNYQMIFGANPNDKADVQTDIFGNKVRVFEMNKGQIDQYAREALSDPQFMARHQDLIIQKPDMLGAGSYKYKPNQDIATTYLQEQYENSFTQAPAIPSTATQPIVRGQMLNYGMPNFNLPSLDDDTEEGIEYEEDDDEFPTVGNIANF